MLKRFLKEVGHKYLAAVIAATLAVVTANAAFYTWSKTAASNASADSSINWAEGMAPSSINDSARAMMARLAEYRDDISGALTTAGTSTAYTLTTNEGVASPPVDGQMIAFTMNVTSGIAPTLAVDGGTAYPIQSAAGTASSAGDLIAGTPYTAKFDSSASAWVLRNFYGNSSVPIGTVLAYSGSAAPSSSFALAYGQCISRTTYATYFAIVSTTYGTCDGSTTFGVPDLRGRVVAGKDDMGGTAASRLTSAGSGIDGATLGASGGSETHTLTQSELSVSLGSATSTVSGTGTITNGLAVNTGSLTFSFPSGSSVGFPVSGLAVDMSGVSVTTTITNSSGGHAHNITQPSEVLSYIVRIQ